MTYSGRTTWKVLQPIDRDGFSITTGGGTSVTLAVAFISSTEAQGTLEIAVSSGGCAGLNFTTPWYATRQ